MMKYLEEGGGRVIGGQWIFYIIYLFFLASLYLAQLSSSLIPRI